MIAAGLAGLGISFGVAAAALPLLIRLSERFNLFDHPGEERKIHSKRTSFLGGTGIMIGYFIGVGVVGAIFSLQPHYIAMLWAAIFGTFLTGLADDFFNLRASIRFLLQFMLGGLLVYKSDLVLPINDILGFTAAIPHGNLILTVVILSAITNAFNLIDGMDGLAGTLALIASAAYSVINLLENDIYFAVVAMALTGCLIAFLLFNRSPASIFMGDNGSYLVGLVLSVLTVNFIANTDVPDLSLQNRFAIGLSLIAVPSFDLVRLFLTRIVRGQSPFVADRNHIHHLLLDVGLPVSKVLVSVAGLSVFIVLSALLTMRHVPFLVFAVSSTALYTLILLFLKRILRSRGEQEA